MHKTFVPNVFRTNDCITTTATYNVINCPQALLFNLFSSDARRRLTDKWHNLTGSQNHSFFIEHKFLYISMRAGHTLAAYILEQTIVNCYFMTIYDIFVFTHWSATVNHREAAEAWRSSLLSRLLVKRSLVASLAAARVFSSVELSHCLVEAL